VTGKACLAVPFAHLWSGMFMVKKTTYMEKKLKLFFDALEQGRSDSIRAEDRITEEDVQVAKRLVDWAKANSKDIALNFPDPEKPRGKLLHTVSINQSPPSFSYLVEACKRRNWWRARC
jgi:hypothetical protein